MIKGDNINLEKYVFSGYDNYKLFDLEGRLLSSGAINSNSVYVGDLSPNIYYLKLFKQNKIRTIRILLNE